MAYKYNANCFIKGKIDSLEKNSFVIKDTGRDFEILNVSIKSGENRIKGKFMNPKDSPSFIDDIIEDYKRDDTVGISGRLVERIYTDKKGQEKKDTTPIFYKIIKGDPTERDSSTFMIQGFVGRTKELENGNYKIYFDVFNEDKDGNIKLNTFETEASEDVMSEMYDQGFEEKAFVKVAGNLVNKFILDDFNQVVDSERGLKVEKMYTCYIPDEVDETEMALYVEAKKASKNGKTIKRKPTNEEIDEDDKKPKGRNRRSTFEEDED